jgi:hypothetical protein
MRHGFVTAIEISKFGGQNPPSINLWRRVGKSMTSVTVITRGQATVECVLRLIWWHLTDAES